jgi:hypothetical protein
VKLVLKRDEAIGSSIKLHNEKLHNLYLSQNIIRVTKSKNMRWVRHVACMQPPWNAYMFLMGKPEGKRSLGRCRWEDNIKIDVREIGRTCY